MFFSATGTGRRCGFWERSIKSNSIVNIRSSHVLELHPLIFLNRSGVLVIMCLKMVGSACLALETTAAIWISANEFLRLCNIIIIHVRSLLLLLSLQACLYFVVFSSGP